MVRYGLIGLTLLFTGIFPLYSQPSIQVVYTDVSPVIDGWIREDAWTNAARIDDFYQREPRNGEPVSEKTEFLFMYDRNNLYIAFRCSAEPDNITSKEMARDVDLSNDDRVQVILDTYLDGRNGYWFQIGPRGSIGDALISQNGKDFNKAWDGLWNGKARITPEGWTAEIFIPFKTLAFRKGQDTWGLKLIRHIKKKSESSYWPATSLNADRFQVSDAGRITGLSGITQGIGLDLIPYVTTGILKETDKDPNLLLDAGLDVFYQITPSLKAALTVNTDFAQTEVDLKQINLTRFSLFFPEKRDFFLDGANYFNFGITGDVEGQKNTSLIPYFSRRIGLDPEGNPVALRYGGKFTGQVGKWNIGMLHVKDDNPWDNPGYSVGRVIRNFGKQSSVGIMGTYGNALSEAENVLAGIDLRLASSEIRQNKNLVFNLYALKSFTDSLRGNDISLGAEVNYPNDFINFRLGYYQIGEDFTAGLGFVPRRDIRDYYGNFVIGPRPRESVILQIKSGISYSFITGFKTADLQSAEIKLGFCEVTFLSGDLAILSSRFQFESLKEGFSIFDDYVIPAGNYEFWSHSLYLASAKRRNLWASTLVSHGRFYSGTRTNVNLQLGYKIAVPVYTSVQSDLNFVNLPEGSFETQIYRLNLNLLFNPVVSLYSFVQYDNKSGTVGWQSRFQWIIKPGREVFFTWNAPVMDPLERFHMESYEARVKVNYTIRF